MADMTRTMPELHVGRGWEVGPLTVFPLWTSAAGVRGLVTGAAARVVAAEREGSPVVDELVLTNTGNRPALLVDGELLEGGWQHRVLEHDVVLAPEGSMVAHVSCVEAGRWRGASGHVRRGRRASGAVRAGLQAAPAARQTEVWRRVADLDRLMGPSPTSSFVDHLDVVDGHRSQPSDRRPPRDDNLTDVAEQVRLLRPLAGQRGVLVGLAGQPALLELYSSRGALAAHLPGLLAGLLLDAVVGGSVAAPTPGHRARRMVARLDHQRLEPAPGVDAGIADPVTVRGEYAVVRGVTVGHGWAHLTAFNRHHPLLDVA